VAIAGYRHKERERTVIIISRERKQKERKKESVKENLEISRLFSEMSNKRKEENAKAFCGRNNTTFLRYCQSHSFKMKENERVKEKCD
jgi:hypothetical protein